MYSVLFELERAKNSKSLEIFHMLLSNPAIERMPERTTQTPHRTIDSHERPKNATNANGVFLKNACNYTRDLERLFFFLLNSPA